MQVSVFKNASNPTTWFDRPLNLVLAQIQRGTFVEQVLEVRHAKTEQEKDKAKQKLPAFTASGQFSYRSKRNLIAHSGFLCMDLDKVPNLAEVRKIIDNDPYTYASFLSCSGKGLAFLVKIDATMHLESFLCIEQYYKEKTIPIQSDRSCKDVCRLRFISHDPALYFFQESFIWEDFSFLTTKKEKPKPKNYTYKHQGDASTQMDYLVMAIESAGADITADYADWVTIALALNAEFGESGIDYFHRISYMNSEYSHEETEKKYRECNRPYKINSISPIFNIAKKNGIDLTTKNRI